MSEQNVRLESEYTGQTFGQSDIQINPRVDGVIESLNFKEGSIVSKGQLLYTIDPLPYQAKVNQAEGVLAESKAKLAKAKSDLDDRAFGKNECSEPKRIGLCQIGI